MIYLTILQAKSGGMDFIPLLLVMVVFFAFMILPQMRKQKKAKAYLSEIKKGDRVVTTGGIHGKIASVQDTHFVIDMEEGSMKIEKSAISMDMTNAAYKNAAPKETTTEA